jgi:hypothetical protein
MCLDPDLGPVTDGIRQPLKPMRLQVAISDIVALLGLYCDEPPTARMRILQAVPDMWFG